MTRSRRLALVPPAATALLAVLLTGCSDDPGGTAAAPGTSAAVADDTAAPAGEGSSSAAPPSGPGDVDRYCTVVAQVNATAEEVFAGAAEDAPASEVQLRWQQLLDRAAPQFTEMPAVAPAEIADDVPVFLADLRARAETGQSPDSTTAQAAEERIRAFEEQHCPGGPDGS